MAASATTPGSDTPGPSRISLGALRPLWLALPFAPWLASLIPWFAPAFVWSWFLLAFYFWPSHMLALHWDPRLTDAPWQHLLRFLYCLALAFALELGMRAFGMHHGRWRLVRRRAAASLVVACASVALCVFALRYAQWIGWPPRSGPDHALSGLRQQAGTLRELSVYEMPGGLLDHLYVAKLRLSQDSLPELVRSLELAPVPEAEIDESFWTAPAAYWWRPPRTGRFYASPGFSLTERGWDGDFYLLLQSPADDALWILQRSNF